MGLFLYLPWAALLLTRVYSIKTLLGVTTCLSGVSVFRWSFVFYTILFRSFLCSLCFLPFFVYTAPLYTLYFFLFFFFCVFPFFLSLKVFLYSFFNSSCRRSACLYPTSGTVCLAGRAAAQKSVFFSSLRTVDMSL